MNNTSSFYNALSALVSAIGPRERNSLLLDKAASDRLREDRPAVRVPTPVKPLTVATSCGRCNENLVEVELGRGQEVPRPYCDLCMDELIRKYPKGVL